MTDPKDILERLTKWAALRDNGPYGPSYDLRAIADHMEAQAAEIERLRRALRRVIEEIEDCAQNPITTAEEFTRRIASEALAALDKADDA